MVRKAKLGVIGCGGLAGNQHIPNIYRSENAVLSSLCDIREEHVKNLAEKYSVPCWTNDYTEILKNPEIDGVVIATKHDQHVKLTIEALQSGKNVYVEKPLAETAKECEDVEQAVKESGKLVIVGMNRRMAPAYRMAKQLLDEKGGVKNIYYRIADCYSYTWGRKFEKDTRVIHEACHIFDILRFFTGSDPVSMYCLSARSDDESYTIKFRNGAIATIICSGYSNSDFPKEHFEAIADGGALTVEDFVELRQFSLSDKFPQKNTFYGHCHPDHDIIAYDLLKDIGCEALYSIRRNRMRYRDKVAELEKENKTGTKEYQDAKFFLDHQPHENYFVNKGWPVAMDHFADLIVNGGECKAATAHDGLMSVRMIEAAIKSRKTGDVVRL